MPLTATREKIGLGIGIAIAMGWFGVSLVSRYSPPDHSARFRRPALSFVQAGLAQDSAGLARSDVSPSAVSWILDRGRRDPDLLRALAADLRVSGTMSNGTSNEVRFETKNLERCRQWPLILYFSGAPTSTRIESVQSSCDAR